MKSRMIPLVALILGAASCRFDGGPQQEVQPPPAPTHEVNYDGPFKGGYMKITSGLGEGTPNTVYFRDHMVSHEATREITLIDGDRDNHFDRYTTRQRRNGRWVETGGSYDPESFDGSTFAAQFLYDITSGAHEISVYAAQQSADEWRSTFGLTGGVENVGVGNGE